MRTNLIIRVSRVILSGALLSLATLWGLALVACTAGTPATEMMVNSTAAPEPDNPASLAPTASLLPSPAGSSIHQPLVSPSPTFSPFLLATPVITLPVTPAAEFDIFKLSPLIHARTPTNLTMPFELGVINKEPISRPETIFLIYDGDPKAGGELILQADLPEVPAADPKNPVDHPGTVSKNVSWDVRGEGGTHQLFAYLCLADVRPSTNTCRIWDFAEEIPQLVWAVEVLGGANVAEYIEGINYGMERPKHFQRGEQVPVRIYAANLDPTETFSFALKSWVDSRVSSPVTYPLGVDNLQLPPGQVFERVYHYDTSLMPGPGGMAFLQLWGIEAQLPRLSGYSAQTKAANFTLPFGIYVTADPLTGTVPLTVTFVDLSATPDGYPFESWLWSFGDGLTSTERFPTHTYTIPGTYSIVLTTTAPGEKLEWIREGLRWNQLDPGMYDQTYTFTLTRPVSITVLP